MTKKTAEEIKACLRCGFEHNDKRRKYCNRVIEKNCANPECGKKFETKCNSSEKMMCGTLCASTYANKVRIESADRISRKCPQCEVEFETIEGSSGKTYCSKRCQGQFNNDKASEKRREKRSGKICPRCKSSHENHLSDYCGKRTTKECLNCAVKFDYKCLRRERDYCGKECARIARVESLKYGGTEKKCPRCKNTHKNKRSEYCKEWKSLICPICDGKYERKCSGKMNETCSKRCATLQSISRRAKVTNELRLKKKKVKKEQVNKKIDNLSRMKGKERFERDEVTRVNSKEAGVELEKIKRCVNCNDGHLNEDSQYCERVKTVKCDECRENYSIKCENEFNVPQQTKICSQECRLQRDERIKQESEDLRDLEHERTVSLIKRGKLKKCLLCDFYHENESEYCQEMSYSNCLNCNKQFLRKCCNEVKKYCSNSCSRERKINECLNCNEPAKEKYCRREIIIICKMCRKEHRAKCGGKGIPTYCSGQCANKDDAVKARSKETQFRNNNGKWAFNTEKQRETMLKKYGSLGRLGDPNELERQKETMMKNHGVEFPSQKAEFLNKGLNTLMEKYGRIFNTTGSPVSKVNLNFANKIEDKLGLEVTLEYIVKSHGILFDLYIPEYKIALEINPTITHNSTRSYVCVTNDCEIDCKEHKPASHDGHLKRAKIAQDNNIDLIQVYDWDQEEEVLKLVKSKVKSKDNNSKIAREGLVVDRVTPENVSWGNYVSLTSSVSKLEGSIMYELSNDEKQLAIGIFRKLSDGWIFDCFAGEIICESYFNMIFELFIKEFEPSSVTSYLSFDRFSEKTPFLSRMNFCEVVEHKSKLILCKDDNVLHSSEGVNINSLLSEGFVEVYTSGDRKFVWTKSES